MWNGDSCFCKTPCYWRFTAVPRRSRLVRAAASRRGSSLRRNALLTHLRLSRARRATLEPAANRLIFAFQVVHSTWTRPPCFRPAFPSTQRLQRERRNARVSRFSRGNVPPRRKPSVRRSLRHPALPPATARRSHLGRTALPASLAAYSSTIPLVWTWKHRQVRRDVSWKFDLRAGRQFRPCRRPVI